MSGQQVLGLQQCDSQLLDAGVRIVDDQVLQGDNMVRLTQALEELFVRVRERMHRLFSVPNCNSNFFVQCLVRPLKLRCCDLRCRYDAVETAGPLLRALLLALALGRHRTNGGLRGQETLKRRRRGSIEREQGERLPERLKVGGFGTRLKGFGTRLKVGGGGGKDLVKVREMCRCRWYLWETVLVGHHDATGLQPLKGI